MFAEQLVAEREKYAIDTRWCAVRVKARLHIKMPITHGSAVPVRRVFAAMSAADPEKCVQREMLPCVVRRMHRLPIRMKKMCGSVVRTEAVFVGHLVAVRMKYAQIREHLSVVRS